MGRMALAGDDRTQAEELIGQAIELFEAIGDRYSIGALWGNCGFALVRASRPAEARPWLERAAAHFHEIGMPDQAATAERAIEAIDGET